MAEEEEEGRGRKEFLCNISLVKALQQFLPVADRKSVQDWVKKLRSIEDGSEEANMRNEYISYLVIKIQNGVLTQPFNRSPPVRLLPLSEVLPGPLYEEVQKQLKVSHCRTNRLLNASGEYYEMPDVRCDPSCFQTEHPRPRKGVIASFAVFSNYDDN